MWQRTTSESKIRDDLKNRLEELGFKLILQSGLRLVPDILGMKNMQPFIVELLDAPEHLLVVLAESYDDVPKHVKKSYGAKIKFKFLQCWASEGPVFVVSPSIFREPKPKGKEKTLKGGLE